MEYYAIYCKTTRKTLEAHYLLENVFIEVYTVWKTSMVLISDVIPIALINARG